MKLSTPNKMIRLEGATILLASLFAYYQLGYSWWIFALLFLWPDLAIVVYALNETAGMHVYNILHTLTLPLILLGAAIFLTWPVALQFALIWLAHIGMDRMVGYGLKYSTGFKDTHLNRI